MSPLALGPLVGVLLVIVLSGAGIALARVLGGNVHEAVTQVYGAATVVLLVTIASRIERLRHELRSKDEDPEP
jgi:hypothetical protein